jgi:hypothetical protein
MNYLALCSLEGAIDRAIKDLEKELTDTDALVNGGRLTATGADYFAKQVVEIKAGIVQMRAERVRVSAERWAAILAKETA